jgi:cyanophycin synthetase
MRRAVFAAGAGSPYVMNSANAASIARDKAFCARALSARGVPVVSGEMFFVTPRWSDMRSPGRELDDAFAFTARAKYPIFCKPISASNGLYAEIIDDFEAFQNYVARVAREHFAILVQPVLRGAEYRVFVLNGRPLFSYRKRLPVVLGDGESTLAALSGRERPRGRDESGVSYCASDVPPRGARIGLEGPANRSVGGGVEVLIEGAPAPLANIALAAADALGLDLAGVDIFDVSPARDFSDLLVIEVNSNPMIATLEDHGRWDLIETIWRANIDAALR